MFPRTCLIVDDEPLCRTHLRLLLSDEMGLSVVGEAACVQTALHAIETLTPDVVFLDVQLGTQSGFNVLSQLQSPPNVIFVTGYDQYAVRAFEVNAIDYLLKPVTSARLRSAIGRLGKNSTSSSANTVFRPDDVVMLGQGASGFFAPIHEILLIEASNHHSRVTLDCGRLCIVRRSMREWVQMLPPNRFHVLDRSFLLNLERIHTIEWSSRRGVVTFGSQRLTLAVGRAAARRLRTVIPLQPPPFG